MIQKYFRDLYRRTMDEAYGFAHSEIVSALENGGACLDCGASSGQKYQILNSKINVELEQYFGVEWDEELVSKAKQSGLNVNKGNLNRELDFPDEKFQCVFALSVLEHLLNPCRFMKEAMRVLKPGGVFIVLTPNISTFFTAMLILLGKMPSSGPHPDSDILLDSQELFRVKPDSVQTDTEGDEPVHRHLVVFSFLVLKKYLKMIGFDLVHCKGYGLYPFPNFCQPLLEKIDPYHCHQSVFVVRKPVPV